MKIEITTEEKLKILKFYKKIRQKKYEHGEVDVVHSSKESKDFIKKFLKSRGIGRRNNLMDKIRTYLDFDDSVKTLNFSPWKNGLKDIN